MSRRRGTPRAENGLDETTATLLVQAAERYYLKAQTQAEVARALGISRPQVSRLLKRGREAGIVTITIRSPFDRAVDLERELADGFKLQEAVVVPESGTPESRVARAAAEYLASRLQRESVLGVSWGRTVRMVIDLLPPGGAGGIEVVPLVGGMGPVGAEIHANEIARQAATRLGGRYYVMSAPALAQSPRSYAALRHDPAVHGILARAGRVELALVGIGGLVPESTLVRAGYLRSEDLRQLRRAGAVGDICSRFFGLDGSPCRTPITGRVVGIELADLGRIPTVIGVAVGPEKAAPIVGALRGGYVRVLVTDAPTAKEALRIAASGSAGARSAGVDR